MPSGGLNRCWLREMHDDVVTPHFFTALRSGTRGAQVSQRARRHAEGFSPTTLRNIFDKCGWSHRPQQCAISLSGRSVLSIMP